MISFRRGGLDWRFWDALLRLAGFASTAAANPGTIEAFSRPHRSLRSPGVRDGTRWTASSPVGGNTGFLSWFSSRPIARDELVQASPNDGATATSTSPSRL